MALSGTRFSAKRVALAHTQQTSVQTMQTRMALAAKLRLARSSLPARSIQLATELAH